jgi:hypothetical protein
VLDPVDRSRRGGGPPRRCELCAKKKAASEFNAKSKVCKPCERARSKQVRIVPGGAPGTNRKKR